MPFPKMSLAANRELLTVIMMLPVYGLAATVEEVSVPRAPLECLLIEHASIKGNLANDPLYGRANIGHQIAPGAMTVLSVRA